MIGVGSQCGGGYQFSTSGSKVVEVRYNYVTIGKFTINVAEKKSTTAGRTSTSPTCGHAIRKTTTIFLVYVHPGIQNL